MDKLNAFTIFPSALPLSLYRDVFLVCPMKSAPVLLRREAEKGEDYVHTSLPTQGEVRWHSWGSE